MKLYKIILLLLLGFSLLCCDENASESDSNRLVADTLNGMKERIKELETMVSETKSDVDSLKTKSEETKSNKFREICLLGVGLIGIVMAIAAIHIANKQKKRLNRDRNDIENLKKQFSDFNNTTVKCNSTVSHVPSGEYSELLRRISSLEGFRNQLKANASQSGVSQQSSMPTDKNTRHGYFGTAIVGKGGKGYFKKLLSNGEDARFSVQVVDENAEFEPIVQVDAITSIDAMDLAIEFEGVSKSEAINMSVKQNGVAKLMDEKWIIIQKAVVILKK